jgi:hypothetical protein
MATLSGHGIALIPLFLIGDDLEAGRLRRVLPEYRDLSRSVYAVCSGPAPLSPSVEAFVEFLKFCFDASRGRAGGGVPVLPGAEPDATKLTADNPERRGVPGRLNLL